MSCDVLCCDVMSCHVMSCDVMSAVPEGGHRLLEVVAAQYGQAGGAQGEVLQHCTSQGRGG